MVDACSRPSAHESYLGAPSPHAQGETVDRSQDRDRTSSTIRYRMPPVQCQQPTWGAQARKAEHEQKHVHITWTTAKKLKTILHMLFGKVEKHMQNKIAYARDFRVVNIHIPIIYFGPTNFFIPKPRRLPAAAAPPRAPAGVRWPASRASRGRNSWASRGPGRLAGVPRRAGASRLGAPIRRARVAWRSSWHSPHRWRCTNRRYGLRRHDTAEDG